MSRYKDELTGTGKVFAFTLSQFIKSKANIITLVVFMLLALASVPVGSVFAGRSLPSEISSAAASEIDTVYVQNDTALSPDFQAIAESPYYSGVNFITGGGARSEFESAAPGRNVCAVISKSPDGGSYALTLLLSEASALSEEETSALTDALTRAIRSAQRISLGVSEESLAILDSSVSFAVTDEDGYENAPTDDGESWGAKYALQLFYAVIVMVVSVYSVSFIIQAVIEEKASKLVELLMVSVKPLALIVGKILASMAFVSSFLIVIVLCFILSYRVSGLFLDISPATAYIAQLGVGAFRMDLLTIVIGLVSILLGHLTFSLLAGLSGASCSSTQDISGASSASSLIIMVCYMLSIFVGSFGSRTLSVVCSLLPFISIFCAPAQYAIGNIGLWQLALAWLIQLAVIAAIALLCARVYSALLMHRGQRIKLRGILSLARGQRAGKGAA